MTSSSHAIRWSRPWLKSGRDKRGYESVVPLSRDARAAIDVYLRRHPKAGDVPLLPSNAEPHLACGKILAGRWLSRAEKLAKLPKLARGAWHPFRRSFASERRHLPDVDIMAVAGWRSSRVMRESYQHAHGQGMLSVVDPTESRPKTERQWHKRGTGGREVIALCALNCARLRLAPA